MGGRGSGGPGGGGGGGVRTEGGVSLMTHDYSRRKTSDVSLSGHVEPCLFVLCHCSAILGMFVSVVVTCESGLTVSEFHRFVNLTLEFHRVNI